MSMKWRGIPIPDLTDAELLNALRRTLTILAEIWAEVARRHLIDRV